MNIAPTDGAEDSLFREPYVDVDEWRDSPASHHHLHGGFRGSDTLFSIYPSPENSIVGREGVVPHLPG